MFFKNAISFFVQMFLFTKKYWVHHLSAFKKYI